MKFNLNILYSLMVVLMLTACNSNKKNVDDPKDISNFKRIGNVDTTHVLNVVPGDVASIDAYVDQTRRSAIKKLRQVSEGETRTDLIIGGKLNNVLQVKMEKNTPVSLTAKEYIFRNGALVYYEESTMDPNTAARKTTKHYIADNNIVKSFESEAASKMDIKEGGKSGSASKEIATSTIIVPTLLSEVNNIYSQFSAIPGFEGKVTKTGESFTFTGCFDGEVYKIVDPGNLIAKAYTENNVPAESYLFAVIDGTLNGQSKTITVKSLTMASGGGGKYDCL